MFCVIAKTKQNRTNSKSWVYQKKKQVIKKFIEKIVHQKLMKNKYFSWAIIFVFVNKCYIVITYDTFILKKRLGEIPKALIDC